MSPNLVEHLTAFIAVAETGSFTIAARNLNRGVSSISYSLAQLETHCGFSLLDRGSKQSELTERGRALFAEAKAVVERARRFASHAASLEKGNETRIRIAVDVIFPLATLHAALIPFVQTHERVRLQLFTSSLNSLWEELRSSEVDFGLSLLAAIPLDMEGRSFSQITLSPVATANHPLAQLEQPLSLADFQRERQIYYVGSPEIDMERVGRVFSSDVWTANDLEHIRLMVRNGFGWSFGSEAFFAEELRAGTVRMLRCIDAQLHPTRTIGAVWPVGRRPGPLGRELIDLVGGALSATTSSPTNLPPECGTA